jgi:protein-S-isoprenylcysteine O-methyltransferase Ste14
MSTDSGITHRGAKETTTKSQSQDNAKAEVKTTDKFADTIWDIAFNFPPRIKTFTLAQYANAFKATVLPYMLFLMYYFDNWSIGCWVYMSLHGSYGFLWNLKTMAFPDPGHQVRVTIGSCPMMLGVIFSYWYIAYMMASGQSEQNPAPERIFWSVLTFAMGAALMMIADAQKYFVLRLKKGLIDYGMFARTRNPNYLGEMMIYGSMAVLSNRTLPWIILLSVWIGVFSLMIYIKERSFRRKEGWERYSKQSSLILPKIVTNDFINFAIWGALIYAGYYVWNQGGLFPLLKRLR